MAWANGYTFKRQVNFDHNQCGTADQTNFPALIGAQGALAYLATVANGGGIQNTVSSNGVTVPADLIFTSDSAGSTLLSWEIAYYDATTGAIEIWVNLPTLNHLTTDTIIYMWYGNSGVSTYQCTPSATWNSDFQFVYHGGDGTTLNLNDSTSHARTLTNHSATAAAGPVVGGGFSVVSATPSYLSTGYNSPTGSWTIEGWVDFTGTFGGSYRYWLSSFSSGTLAGIAAAIQGTVSKRLTVQCANGGSVTECSDLTTRSASTWYHVVITYDGGNLRIFINGSILNTVSYGGQGTGSGFVIGGDGDFAGSVGAVDWDGYIDEVRFSTTARNSDWDIPSYNNQKPSSSFVTIGGQQLNESFTLGCGAGITDSAIVAYTPSITLGVGLSVTESAQLAAVNSFALGVAASCAPTVVSNIMEAITLGVAAHIGESVTVQVFLAMALGIGASVAESSQLAAVNSLTLGLSAGETLAAQLAAVSSISLGAACGVSPVAALEAIASLAFGMLAGISDSAKLDAVDVLDLGAAVDVIAPGSANKETEFTLAVAVAAAVTFVKSGGPGEFKPDAPGTPGGFRSNTAGTPGTFRPGDGAAPGVFKPDPD